ncbi:MAG: FMN-binding protein [Propionibacteriaceae bacterium]
MSTKSKAAVLVASAGVLLAGWGIGTANGQTVTSTAGTGTTTTSTGTTATTATTGATASSTATTGATTSSTATSGTTTSSGTTSSSSSSSSGTTYKDGTYTGTNVSERFGTVQVTVTISGGKITNVQAATTVYEQRSSQFVSRATSVLKPAVIAANSANVSTVSGATYTSQAYLSSLQSALDKAK